MGDNDINQYSTASQRLFANLVWRLRYEAAAMYSGLSSLLKSPSVACLRRLQQTRQSAVHLYPWIRALACSLHLQAGQCGKLKLELHALPNGDDFEINRGLKFGVADPYQIPQGHYFMLGDSRDNSMDSRYRGTVPRELIVGKALMIVDSKAKGHEGRSFKPLK